MNVDNDAWLTSKPVRLTEKFVSQASVAALLVITVAAGVERGSRTYMGPIAPYESAVDPFGALSSPVHSSAQQRPFC